MPVNMPPVVAVKAREVAAQATRHVLVRLDDGSMKHRKVQRPRFCMRCMRRRRKFSC
jgi:hypothetical protein